MCMPINLRSLESLLPLVLGIIPAAVTYLLYIKLVQDHATRFISKKTISTTIITLDFSIILMVILEIITNVLIVLRLV